MTTAYTPHDWNTDDDITEALLDHIEQGVKTATDGVIAVETADIDEWSLDNGWMNYENGYTIARAIKSNGFVTLEGLISGGEDNTVAMTLAEGFRPSGKVRFAVAASDGFGDVTVETDGQVRVQRGSATWTSLSGITYYVG